MTEEEQQVATEHSPTGPGPVTRGAGRIRAEQLTNEEMTIAALAHLSVVLGFITGGLAGVVIALVIWLAYREKSEYVAFQAIQAVAFQLVLTAVMIVAGAAILISTLTICLIPLALVLLAGLIALPFAQLVYGLYAAYETYYGADFKYWAIGDFARQLGGAT